MAENYIDKSKQMQTNLVKQASLTKVSKSVSKNVFNKSKLKIEKDDVSEDLQKSENDNENQNEPIFEAERKKRVRVDKLTDIRYFSCSRCIKRKRSRRCKPQLIIL